MKPHPTAWESIANLAGTEHDSGDVVLSKRDCIQLVKERLALIRRDWATSVLIELLRRDVISGPFCAATLLSQVETMRLAKEQFYHLPRPVREALGECP